MPYCQTVRDVVPALMQLREILLDPMLDAECRRIAERTVLMAHDFLIERQDSLREERARLRQVGDLVAMAEAAFIERLLTSYDNAARTAASVLADPFFKD